MNKLGGNQSDYQYQHHIEAGEADDMVVMTGLDI